MKLDKPSLIILFSLLCFSLGFGFGFFLKSIQTPKPILEELKTERLQLKQRTYEIDSVLLQNRLQIDSIIQSNVLHPDSAFNALQRRYATP